MHWTYIGSVERGERNISLVNIVRFARALGMGPEEFVRGLRPQAAPTENARWRGRCAGLAQHAWRCLD